MMKVRTQTKIAYNAFNATETLMDKTFSVTFQYVDFDGAVKRAECLIDVEDGKFSATNLSKFGCGKEATSISGAITFLIGHRHVIGYDLLSI